MYSQLDDLENRDPKRVSSIDRFFRLKVASISSENEFTKRLLAYYINESDGSTDDQDETITILLRGIWIQTELKIGSIVHVIQPQYDDASKIYTVDNSSGVLVLEPDRQISCTAVATSLFCERKSWLTNIFLCRVGTHPNVVIGTLVHDVLLHALRYRVESPVELTKYLDDILCRPSMMLEIFATGEHLTYYREEVLKYLDNIQEWICKYVHSGSRNSLKNNSEMGVRLKEICDIENVVQSPRYGIKGKVDITGTVRIYDRRSKKFSDHLTALEVKSGCSRLSLSHGAQVNLYTMILDEMHQTSCNTGFVTYLKDETDMYESQATQNVKRDLIHRRNQLALYFQDFFVGPTMLDRTINCQPCEKLTECLVTQKLYENNLERYPNMASLEVSALNHLDANMLQFFKRQYERFIRLLELHQAREQSLDDFELIGEGFCRLKLVSTPQNSSRPDLLTFERHPVYIENYVTSKRLKTTNSQPLTGRRMATADDDSSDETNDEIHPMQLRRFDTTSSNCVGQRVFVRQNQAAKSAAALGVMQQVDEHRLVVKLFDKQRAKNMDPNLVYRIDKVFHERETRLYTMRRNLSKLVERRSRQAAKVRQLVSDESYEMKFNQTTRSNIEASGDEELFELASEQQSAIANAISTENYYIISDQIAVESRQQLHERVALMLNIIGSLSYSTLLVAQNLDHLISLMRLLQANEHQFFLLDDGKSREARRKFARHLIEPLQDARVPPAQKFDRFIEQYARAPVVLTTYAAAATSLLFTRRAFDYCIAYDCDKTDVLAALAPLFCCDRHIIIDLRLAQLETSGEPENLARDDSIVSLGDHLRSLRPPHSTLASSESAHSGQSAQSTTHSSPDQ